MNTSPAVVAQNAHRLAAFLDAHPDLPEPTHYSVQFGAEVKWLIWSDNHEDQKNLAEKVVRFIPGPAAKRVVGNWMEYSGEVDGVLWSVTASREAVCERVVVGVTTVTREVPDPSVVVPLVEVTEEVETVEWKCSPLLESSVTA